MEIKNAEFVTSFSDWQKYLEESEKYDCKEICVVGRSNVGKSSFINMLSRRNKLAKTSSSPGRTRLINLFSFNDMSFVLVDLPGYGYAETSKAEKDKWGTLIEGYLNNSRKLSRVLFLVDLRHPPTVQDKQMANYMYALSLPFTVIATKADKLSKAEAGRSLQTLATLLAIGRDDIIPVSNQTGYNREAVLKKLDEILL